MKSNLAVVSCKLSHVGAILSGNAGVDVLVGGKGNNGGCGGGKVNPELAAEKNHFFFKSDFHFFQKSNSFPQNENNQFYVVSYLM